MLGTVEDVCEAYSSAYIIIKRHTGLHKLLCKNYSDPPSPHAGGKDAFAPTYDIHHVRDYKLAHFTRPHNLDGRDNIQDFRA